MILRHSGWQTLVAEVRSRAPELARVPDRVLCAVLAAPCAVAMWIARRSSLTEKAVSILILGAETADAVDEGRWYQYVPLLLDAAFTVDVTLVGSELDAQFVSSAAAHAPAKAARTAQTHLGAFFSERRSQRFDLAVAFHPGLQKHRGWLAPDAFARLLERGVSLVCAAFGPDEYEMERWVVESYGYQADSNPLMNPFFLDVSDAKASIRWGSVLWQIIAGPRSGTSPDQARLAALENLNRMVMHSMTARAGSGLPYGHAVELAASDGRKLRLLHVADQRFVDAGSGDVLWLDNGELKHVMRVPPEVADSYPGSHSSDLLKALWAARIKADHLLPSYPPDALADSAAVAAGMLSELKQKVAGAFKG